MKISTVVVHVQLKVASNDFSHTQKWKNFPEEQTPDPPKYFVGPPCLFDLEPPVDSCNVNLYNYLLACVLNIMAVALFCAFWAIFSVWTVCTSKLWNLHMRTRLWVKIGHTTYFILEYHFKKVHGWSALLASFEMLSILMLNLSRNIPAYHAC